MIYFSSDYHFNHANIAGKELSVWPNGYRDFKTIEEMNYTIISTLNSYVKSDDTLYFLGDFAFGNTDKIPELRERIVCQNIHFIKGNHDKKISVYKDSFTSIQDVLKINIEKDQIFLSHYAHRVWPGSHRGNIHLYGHSHGSLPDQGKSMDIGIDVAYKLFGEYKPFSLPEILKIMSSKDIKIVDKHS